MFSYSLLFLEYLFTHLYYFPSLMNPAEDGGQWQRSEGVYRVPTCLRGCPRQCKWNANKVLAYWSSLSLSLSVQVTAMTIDHSNTSSHLHLIVRTMLRCSPNWMQKADTNVLAGQYKLFPTAKLALQGLQLSLRHSHILITPSPLSSSPLILIITLTHPIIILIWPRSP